MDNNRIKEKSFLELIHAGSFSGTMQIAGLFDLLPNIYLFLKDADSRFVHMNRNLLDLLGISEVSELVGRSDADFFSPDLVEQYVEEDLRVMQTGQPIVNETQVVPQRDGRLKWFITSKIPLYDNEGQTVGIAGVMRDCDHIESLPEKYVEMKTVVTYILDHYAERITSDDLASLVHLSPSQFNRRFRQTFDTSPQQFIAKVRIKVARQLLASTDMSISLIAQRTGFYDHSYFTRQFIRHTGLTPLIYRKRFVQTKSTPDSGMY